jgi:hypothetical protein
MTVMSVAGPPCGHLVKRGGEDARSFRDVRFWHLHDSKRSSFVNSRVVSGHADGCRCLQHEILRVVLSSTDVTLSHAAHEQTLEFLPSATPTRLSRRLFIDSTLANLVYNIKRFIFLRKIAVA